MGCAYFNVLDIQQRSAPVNGKELWGQRNCVLVRNLEPVQNQGGVETIENMVRCAHSRNIHFHIAR